ESRSPCRKGRSGPASSRRSATRRGRARRRGGCAIPRRPPRAPGRARDASLVVDVRAPGGATILGRPMIRILLRAALPSLLLILGVAACEASDLPGGACSTCADVYTNGGITCPGGAADAWRDLSFCACGQGPCETVCMPSFCVTKAADANCSACLA